MKCNFRYCGEEIPGGLNGNRRYCDEHCTYAERLEREKEKNAIKKTLISEIKRIESLLRVCYNRYGDTLFDVVVIREMKMNWSLFSLTEKREGYEYRIVGSFGYVVFQDDTIKVIQL